MERQPRRINEEDLDSAKEMERVLSMVHHIQYPCSASDSNGQTLRADHLLLAREMLPTINSPHWRAFLEAAINEYSELED